MFFGLFEGFLKILFSSFWKNVFDFELRFWEGFNLEGSVKV